MQIRKMLSKYTPTDCFFDDFSHWDGIKMTFFRRCYDVLERHYGEHSCYLSY